MSQRFNDIAAQADALTPPEPAQVRTSRTRAEDLKQYIEGLLPSDLAAKVDVVIEPAVETAAVVPATEAALIEGDETGVERQQARHLIEQTDGEYLVLVTGEEASTDDICLSDQLTADAAHQFGLAFHETLHILKTAFDALSTLIESNVAEQYQGFVHQLVNIAEDGAIEHEARTGDDFSDRAANRLTLVRELHSKSLDDLPKNGATVTFGDALLDGLYDKLIYDTGVTDALRDETDERVQFASTDEREAFEDVYPEILEFRDDILALRSDHSDRLYDDDREASVQRAKRTLAFWQDVLKPLVEEGESPQERQQSEQSQQSQQSQQGQHGQSPQQEQGEQQSQQGQRGQQGGHQETPDQPQQDSQHDDGTGEGDPQADQRDSPHDARAGGEETEEAPDADTDADADAGESGPEAESEAGSESDSGGDGDGNDVECPECGDSFDSDHGRRIHYGRSHGDTEDLEEQLDEHAASADSGNRDASSGGDQPADATDIDPDELSLETDTFENPLQGVDEHPSLGEDPDPETVPEPTPQPQGPPAGGDDDSNDGQESAGDGSEDGPADQHDASHDGADGEDEAIDDPATGGDKTPDAGADKPDPADSQATTGGQSPPSATGEEEQSTTDTEAGENGTDTGADDTSSDGGDTPETTTTDSEASTTDLASHASSSSASGGDDQQATFGDFTGGDGGAAPEGADSSSDGGADDAQRGGSDRHSQSQASDDETGPDSPAGDAGADTGTSPQDGQHPDTNAEHTPDGAPTDDTPGEDGSTGDHGDSNSDTDDGMDFDPSEGGQRDQPGLPGGSDGESASGGASTLDPPTGPEASSDSSSNANADASTDTDSSTPADNTDTATAADAASEGRDDAGEMNSAADSDTPETPSGPAHDEADLAPTDFESDRARARRDAQESTINEQALADDLQALQDALGEERATAPSGDGGGDDAGPGSIDELTILPDPAGDEQSQSWDSIERAADGVADTLAKELRLDQQTESRHGLSAGTTVNAKTAHRLNHNDPRTFTETLPGDEKEYFIIIVLDRSGSMAPGYHERTNDIPSKIRVATDAVAKFALACEDLDIDVAIIDFYDDEARYVKPPAVETEFAQEAILTTDTEGGTPLDDALALARSVAESDHKESIILSITDDMPDNISGVEDQIKASYAPICSLTIATDCEYGNPPRQAETLEEQYEQTTTVYDPAALDDRIDELASLLGAY